MKRTITITLLTIALLVAFTTPAAASFGGDLATNLSPTACGGGTPIISVFEPVRNDADSRVGGGYWAFDDFVRNIRVWQTAPGTYCAIVAYGGTFTTIAGRSPQNQADITAGIRGVFYGGYRATFTATGRVSSAGWPTYGFTAAVDYKCTALGDCPGFVDWVGQYFSGVAAFAQPWWGWEYRAGRHGTWINEIAPPGNSGDIT